MTGNLLYSGKVRHRRYLPKPHEFNYNMYYFYFNPDEIAEIARQIPYLSCDAFNYLSFNQKHFIKEKGLSIKESINQLFDDQLEHDYQVLMLSQISCLGFCFNPLTLYFRMSENKLCGLVVEVHNTPWGEKKAYVLSQTTLDESTHHHFTFKKALHVSPFMEMNFEYHLYLKMCDERFILHIENIKNQEKYFDATLNLEGLPFTKSNLDHMIIKNPFPAQKTILGIYWQALKLYLKGIPFIPHPNRIESK